jgi:hypothetical protein
MKIQGARGWSRILAIAASSRPASKNSPETAAFRRIRSRDIAVAVILGLVSLIIYNANLRSITAADTYAARYLPFSILKNQTLALDPILDIVAQGRKPPSTQGLSGTAHWIAKVRGDRYVSKYPVVVPVILSPFYLPATFYLSKAGPDPLLFDRVARIMEKVCASIIAAASVAILYLLLRRRTDERWAVLLSLLYAFGTTTWVISSQALWTHGLAQLLVVSTMFLLTGPSSTVRVLLAGLLCGLIAANRQPDAILAAGLGFYGLWWAGRLRPLFILSGMVPVALTVAYNLVLVGNLAGAYAILVQPDNFNDSVVGGIAGLLASPTRGLFVFSPFLLFIPVFVRRIASEPTGRWLTLAVSCAMVVQLVLYSMIDWRQGMSWGPRWLTDMLPMLIWMLPPIVKGLSRIGLCAFALASIAAISVQAIGAFWYTGVADIPIITAVGPDRMRPAWNIKNASFVAELGHPAVGADLTVHLRGNIDAVTLLNTGSSRQIEVAGWALTDSHSPSDVSLLIDGVPVAGTQDFLARPDVEQALGEKDPAGWRISVPIDTLSPGEHLVATLVRATKGGEPRLLKQTTFEVPTDTEPLQDVTGLPSAAKRARQMLERHQHSDGYWLTTFTSGTRYEEPQPELNTYLNAIMIDVAAPVADISGMSNMLASAGSYLTAQIEADGLVRYHGRPDAPTIGTLGCAITPDSDDTALAWRVAPAPRRSLLQPALSKMKQYRRPDGLYRTWLAPQDQYRCLNPGLDANPADLGIQMHVFLLLEEADKPAAQALCAALTKKTGDDDIWVYYADTPLMIILRQAELENAGCSLQIASEQLRTGIAGQDIWIQAARALNRVQAEPGSRETYERVSNVLETIAADNFSLMETTPPLLYHNDLTASVERFYWSQDFGYALWLRLYFENERMRSRLACGPDKMANQQDALDQTCD